MQLVFLCRPAPYPLLPNGPNCALVDQDRAGSGRRTAVAMRGCRSLGMGRR